MHEPTGSDPVRAVVADDHPAVLRSVCDVLIAAGVDVVGRASNGEDAAAKIEATRPSVAVVDVRMPRLTGIEISARTSRTAPETAVILYTAYGDRALLSEALDAGVRGFVLKEAPLQDLTRAVDMVAGGAVYVDPVLAGVLASAESERIPQLTKREREVLRLLADGLTNEEIGKQLFLSPETVRTHVQKAMRRLEADTRTQAVALALRQSLIS
ncbi:MAG TPA: response regulator transcription factor [Gaiellaceae bacterium]|nr:response regulator transcription factor [Gaiellaceae bacterium]